MTRTGLARKHRFPSRWVHFKVAPEQDGRASVAPAFGLRRLDAAFLFHRRSVALCTDVPRGDTPTQK